MGKKYKKGRKKSTQKLIYIFFSFFTFIFYLSRQFKITTFTKINTYKK